MGEMFLFVDQTLFVFFGDARLAMVKDGFFYDFSEAMIQMVRGFGVDKLKKQFDDKQLDLNQPNQRNSPTWMHRAFRHIAEH